MRHDLARKLSAFLLLALAGLLFLCRPAHAQDLYVSCYDSIQRISPDGRVRVFASDKERLANCQGLAFDSQGYLYVAVFNTSAIIKIAPDGTLQTFASGSLIHHPDALVIDNKDNVYVANNGNDIVKITPQGEGRLFAQDRLLAFSSGLSFGQNGLLYASNPWEDSIVEITAEGKVHPFVKSKELHTPCGLSPSSSGTLYTVFEKSQTLGRLTSVGDVEIVASGEEIKGAVHLAFAPSGALYLVSQGCLRRVAPDGSMQVVVRNLPQSVCCLAFGLPTPAKQAKRGGLIR